MHSCFIRRVIVPLLLLVWMFPILQIDLEATAHRRLHKDQPFTHGAGAPCSCHVPQG